MSTLMRRTLTLIAVLFLAMPSMAAIKFFTDYPNSSPLDSDFFVLQRNQSYINSTPLQVRTLWFLNPVFTGNGSIGGTFTAVSFFGDGSSLTGIPSGPAMTNYVNSVSNLIYQSLSVGFIPSLNGNGTNTAFWGVTTFDELDVGLGYFTNAFFLHTNWPFIGLNGNGQIFQADNPTNNDLSISNALYLQIQSGTNGSLIAATNNDLSVSNNVLAHTVTMAGTSGRITSSTGTAQTLQSNPATTLDVGTEVALLDGAQGYVAVQVQTNAMASATNTLDCQKTDYSFVSPTAMSITGLINKPTTNSANICLSLVNTAGSNWNLTIPTTILTATGTRGTVTVTNGQDRIVWIRYNPGTGHTNLVECPNF